MKELTYIYIMDPTKIFLELFLKNFPDNSKRVERVFYSQW